LKGSNEILFIHIREPEFIDRIKKVFNAKTLLVKNKNVPKIQSNDADANVDKYSYDYVINNDGTLDELKEIVKEFLLKNHEMSLYSFNEAVKKYIGGKTIKSYTTNNVIYELTIEEIDGNWVI
jgi:tRNA U38,U39,U40 pseudouridine synthase TruA